MDAGDGEGDGSGGHVLQLKSRRVVWRRARASRPWQGPLEARRRQHLDARLAAQLLLPVLHPPSELPPAAIRAHRGLPLSGRPSASAAPPLMARPSASPPRSAGPAVETPPPIESLADIVSAQQRASGGGSWGRQSASAAFAGAVDDAVPHRDESRWSGFHLWRTEQQQQQQEQQKQTQTQRAASASLTDTEVGASDVTARPTQHVSSPAQTTWSAWARSLPSRLVGAATRQSRARRPSSSVEPPSSVAAATGEEEGRMSQMQFVVLTAAIAGAQMAWCLELA